MGKIIVIEGIDGSGKNTQSALLVENLKKRNLSASKISFPSYEKTFFGREVGKYLDGQYGGINEIPPQFAAMLYAGDRFEKKDEIRLLTEGDQILVLDRYVPSNIAHQCAKVELKNRESLEHWIAELEYDVYGLPRPDMVIFLDMPATLSQELVMKKELRSYTEKKKDLHENDKDHLTSSHECFRSLVKKNNWISISCSENGDLRTVDEIQSEILKVVLSVANQDTGKEENTPKNLVV
jgi:dTMP kinase